MAIGGETSSALQTARIESTTREGFLALFSWTGEAHALEANVMPSSCTMMRRILPLRVFEQGMGGSRPLGA